MKNLLRKLYLKPVKFLIDYSIKLQFYHKFYLRNLFKINKGIIKYQKPIWCKQKLIVYGNGFLKMGKGCIWGYKRGGHYHNGCIEIQMRSNEAVIDIGERVVSNNNLFICAYNKIEIGSNTLIGLNVTIFDHEAHGIAPDKRREIGAIGKVLIGNNVWLGNNVTILKNTEIGDNSIVAAGAVVSGKFPENVIIGGIPAKIIREL
ncbi:acyltransferase [Carboxylicivirga caseinilyticus]|uniref:acyltransferase n=1 Tax=Carboxylicivirga caseinilyticus TaxID=3417572 RepID=UPI003D33AAE2|nr:acyltransferase [Marinilabiliaceae bacterium A049]